MNIRKARTFQVRYILRRDLEYVCEFDSDQSQQNLIDLLKRGDTTGIVVESKELTVGYCIYSVNKGAIKIKALCVKPEYRRQGAASIMVQKLKSRLQPTLMSPPAYDRLLTYVPENNLVALYFYKSMGFKSKLVKNKFGEFDGIKMTLTGE